MIYISLKLIGSATCASCTIPLDGGREDTFSTIQSSGAKALTALAEKLMRSYAGHEWEVTGQPEMRGVVPSQKYRKPATPKSRRPVQERLV